MDEDPQFLIKNVGEPGCDVILAGGLCALLDQAKALVHVAPTPLALQSIQTHGQRNEGYTSEKELRPDGLNFYECPSL